jgi:hypothetical protein
MACLEEACPNELNLNDVAKHRDTRKDGISQLKKIDKDRLHKYMVNLVKLNTSAKYYVRRIRKEIKRDIVTMLYDGEIQLEKMKLDKLEEVHNIFELWTTYIENKASEEPLP